MLPVLLQFVTACDFEIPKLVQSESIHDLRAVGLQENVNTVLKKLLKTWFNIKDEEQKQAEVFQFLNDAQGLQFLLARMQNMQTTNPYFVIAPANQKELGGEVPKADSSDESAEEENKLNDDILRFVGSKIGLRLTKKESISTSLVLKKNDDEFFKPAKVVMQMRKQTAIFNRSPNRDLGVSPLTRAKKNGGLYDNDQETMQTLKSLIERNFAASLQMIDCSKG